jgi:predicted AAA+ superfamily ATPase
MDLVERFSIRNSRFMKFFLKYLLTNISNLFSANRFYHSLESGLKPSRETLQDYLSHILESEIIFLIPKFSYSLKVQEKNPKKIYCIDNGLRRTAAFLFSKDIGRLAENLVFLELLRRGYEVHYRKDKREVDFIAQKEGRTLAINVCYEDTIPERETEGLKDSGLKADDLFLVTRDTDKELDNIKFVPLWEWLLSRDFF